MARRALFGARQLPRRLLPGLIGVAWLLNACGGGNGTPPPPTATINTLAYVVTTCREGGASGSLQQELQILRDDRAPVVVMPLGPVPLPPTSVECRNNGINRFGPGFVSSGAFQRIGESPDGTVIAFEITDDFSVVVPNAFPPEVEGIYVVRADGSGLRRLGPASRVPSFSGIGIDPYFRFSPDGRTIAFTDLGDDAAGDEAIQVFTQDIVTGRRTQVTQLPPPTKTGITTGGPAFLDDDTIGFFSITNPGGLNPDGEIRVFTVQRDGTQLKVLPLPITLPGSQIVPGFVITGAGRLLLLENLSGESMNGALLGFPQLPIREVFVSDGTNQLQLSNFRNIDTADFGRSLSPDGEHAFFTASADPFGTNPSKNCQLFTTDAFGGGLQQLTRFSEGALSTNGCFYGRAPTGCAITLYNAFAPSQDARTGTVVFYSNCNPFGMNTNGGQLFAVCPDGSALRQLTQTSGLIRQPDGTVTVELPGPYVYGPYR